MISYNLVMKVIGEALGIVFNTVINLVPALLKAMFGIKGALDDAHDQMVAAIFGISVGAVGVISLIITIVVIICKKRHR